MAEIGNTKEDLIHFVFRKHVTENFSTYIVGTKKNVSVLYGNVGTGYTKQ